jgi:hypothetical protein
MLPYKVKCQPKQAELGVGTSSLHMLTYAELGLIFLLVSFAQKSLEGGFKVAHFGLLAVSGDVILELLVSIHHWYQLASPYLVLPQVGSMFFGKLP